MVDCTVNRKVHSTVLERLGFDVIGNDNEQWKRKIDTR